MRILSSLLLFALGCGGATVGETCQSDSECAPLVCNGLYPSAQPTPQQGTCQHPSSLGGVCHRQAECAADLLCIIPAGGTPMAGGTCQRAM